MPSTQTLSCVPRRTAGCRARPPARLRPRPNPAAWRRRSASRLTATCTNSPTSYAWSASPAATFTGGADTGTTSTNGATISANTTFTVTASNGTGSGAGVEGACRSVQLSAALSCPGFNKTIVVNWDWSNGSLAKIDTWQTQNGLGTNGILVVPFIPTGPPTTSWRSSARRITPRPRWSTRSDWRFRRSLAISNPPRVAGSATWLSAAPPRRFTMSSERRPVSGITGKPTAVALTPGVQYYINIAGRQGVTATDPERYAVVRSGGSSSTRIASFGSRCKSRRDTDDLRSGFHARPGSGRGSFIWARRIRAPRDVASAIRHSQAITAKMIMNPFCPFFASPPRSRRVARRLAMPRGCAGRRSGAHARGGHHARRLGRRAHAHSRRAAHRLYHEPAARAGRAQQPARQPDARRARPREGSRQGPGRRAALCARDRAHSRGPDDRADRDRCRGGIRPHERAQRRARPRALSRQPGQVRGPRADRRHAHPVRHHEARRRTPRWRAATDARAKIVAGADFGALAVELVGRSVRERRTRAGSTASPAGKTDPAFEKAAFALKNPGDVSEPVLSRFGYHVIRLESRKPARARIVRRGATADRCARCARSTSPRPATRS